MTKILINSIPHSGNHLVASILENMGFKHNIVGLTLYVGPPFLRRRQKAGINWRTAKQLNNLGFRNAKETALVSVTNPVPVRSSVLETIYSKMSEHEFLIAHMPHTNVAQDLLYQSEIKSITIVRDPRDMILSLLDHVRGRPHHPMHDFLFKTLSSSYARIRALLLRDENKVKNQVSVAQMYHSMLGWEDDPRNLRVRFEELVGKSGGGEKNRQLEAIQEIAGWVSKRNDYSKEAIQRIGENSFGKTTTFRKGNIERWKTEMDRKELELCSECLKEPLERLGYSRESTLLAET